MDTPSPELKQLWIRVLKRVHPDLAIDEIDRHRCERLTKLANEAYHAGDLEALRAVLGPPKLRMYFPPWTPLSYKQLVPASVALVTLIWGGFSLHSVTTSQRVVTSSPTAQVDNIEPSMNAHVELARLSSPKWSGDAIHNRISQNFDPSKILDTPAGATAVLAFTISREGSPQNVTLVGSSGYPSLDLACMNAVRQVSTFEPPEAGNKDSLNVIYDCPYHPQDGQQALQKASAPVASFAEPEPSQLYMKQMDERLHQTFSNYEHVDANVPAGNTAELWFDVNRDGSLSNVRIGKPSGWNSLDYACVRAVQRTGTVGALPEEYTLRTLPATFACTYNGSNALRTPGSVDSAADRSNMYVGSVRNTNP